MRFLLAAWGLRGVSAASLCIRPGRPVEMPGIFCRRSLRQSSGLQNREMKVQVLPPVPSAPPARRSSHILFFLFCLCAGGAVLENNHRGCLWRNDRPAIPGMPTGPCAASTAPGCGPWAESVASAMAGWGRSIMRSHRMQRIRCPLSLMRSILCRSGGCSGMLRPALRPRIGTTCSLRITSATRKRATKLAVSGQIRGKKSQKRPKSAMETGSGGGSPGPHGGDLAPSSADLHTGSF